ncbi:PEGA domain-containing protein [Maridesulfovibrio ferrireducens]|uniref:PEGA domain-containing protein n=1 Tax=Maridesulfovibrio ferrireducens TaxID=246191 RepID=UPI001A1D3C08|nr:PEGA domain-containing protein [Maridesulfovibrio ferrireducens]MBI9111685.1 PEGA domain-containing protein [Maridesulfovibrio ferrireducens]
MNIFKNLVALILVAGITSGCAPQIKMQSVPVSSNPMGASVFVDGKETCQAPCKVDLARNADHILTIKKDQFRQQDVIIKRIYQQEKVMMNAVSSGMRSSSMMVGDKTAWGISSGVNSIDSQEQTGDAYILSPSAVAVTLVPMTPQARLDMTGSLSPDIQSLTDTDRAQISYVLENLKSGSQFSWTNDQTGIQYLIVVHEALSGYAAPTRAFSLKMTSMGHRSLYDAKASRSDSGKWEILGNGASTSMVTSSPSSVQTAQPAKMNSDTFIKDAAKAAAIGAAPTIKGGVTGKSGSSSESYSGSTYTKKTTQTKVKGSVSVNPVQAIDALGTLLDSPKK